MTNYLRATCWAIAMLTLAVGAKLGWVDRGAANTLLMIMPLLAFVTLQANRRSCARVRGA